MQAPGRGEGGVEGCVGSSSKGDTKVQLGAGWGCSAQHRAHELDVGDLIQGNFLQQAGDSSNAAASSQAESRAG